MSTLIANHHLLKVALQVASSLITIGVILLSRGVDYPRLPNPKPLSPHLQCAESPSTSRALSLLNERFSLLFST